MLKFRINSPEPEKFKFNSVLTKTDLCMRIYIHAISTLTALKVTTHKKKTSLMCFCYFGGTHRG